MNDTIQITLIVFFVILLVRRFFLDLKAWLMYKMSLIVLDIKTNGTLVELPDGTKLRVIKKGFLKLSIKEK